MTNVTADIAISVDGFSAGPDQSLEYPFGKGAGNPCTAGCSAGCSRSPRRTPRRSRASSTAKAYIMGRNMFAPGRGDWDLDWKGWWGDEPPYHAPVFVLTHTPREPLAMEGTTFHFVTDGIESALAQAREAAGDGSVSIAGGAATVRQYLRGRADRRAAVARRAGHARRRRAAVRGHRQLRPGAARRLSNHLVTHLTYRVPR